MMPSAGKMMLRAALLVLLLLFWIVVGGIAGQIAVWLAGALAVVWLVREILPTLRRRP